MYVIARSARTLVGGEREGALVVRVTAPPVGGAANEALVAAVALSLSVPPWTVALERGHRGRRKLLSAPSAARGVLEGL